MATNHLIKQSFGNHTMLQKYLNYLRNPEEFPPFPPILYRAVAYDPHNIESIIENEYRKHNVINRRLSRELMNQFALYQQLQTQLNAE
jgi:hypothetical protein